MKDIKCVVIIGSGMMGSGIGAMASLAGKRTILVDVDEKRTREAIINANECINLRLENNLNSKEESENAKALIETSTDLVASVKHADLVIEAIFENVEAKQKVFAQIDNVLDASIPICSNTSGLRITDISALCKHPERTFTTHFWLPAHLVPLVEVVLGEKSDRTMGDEIVAELRKWGKTPVLVKKDLPGQLANRIFQAIIRESIDIVASGLASAEDVDSAISYGMAMRFPVWGPLMHLDAIGLELGMSVQDSVLPHICNQKRSNDYIRNLVSTGFLGASTGQGFYDWKKRDINQAMKKRDSFIIEAVKIMEKMKKEPCA